MRKIRRPLGPVVLDPAGAALTEDDRRRLLHPATGGVILFSRNYDNPEQLRALTDEIERLRQPALPVCVDHEGGRVQRFREGFTAIPPMRELGRLWDRDREAARVAAQAAAYIIAAELAAHGVDFSFTPVLDLDYGASSVIGDRALHSSPEAVGALGAAHGAMMHGKDHGIAAAQGHHGGARLHARPLLGQDELAAREVEAGLREQDGGLQRKHMLAVEVLVQAVEVAGDVL